MSGKILRVIFWGTPAFAVPSLRALVGPTIVSAVVTQPDRPSGRGMKTVVPPAVKSFARSHKIPVLQPESLDDSFVGQIKEYLPAAFFVVAYGALIPDRVLSLSEPPAVNLHPSLLPELRGPSPIQMAILGGLRQTGLTLMQLDAQMDHGPILAQKKIALDPRDTAEKLSEKLSLASEQFVAKHLPRYLRGELEGHEQDHQRATFTKLLKSSDGALDVSHSAAELDRRVRAMSPWPGAFIDIGGTRVKVLSAVPHTGVRPKARFTKSSSGSLLIACADGALEVVQVKPAGSRAMHSSDFLHGRPGLLSR